MVLEEILNKVEILEISHEKLYKLGDFEKALEASEVESFQDKGCIMTPYYVTDGKMYELYAYELTIEMIEKKDFENHIRNVTGQKNIDNVPKEIIERYKNCYIELTENELLHKEILKEYISYLCNSLEIQEEVKKVFSQFDKKKLYFEFY